MNETPMPDEEVPPHALPSDLLHELRTPLNHIIGYSEMLLEQAQEQSRELQRVRARGREKRPYAAGECLEMCVAASGERTVARDMALGDGLCHVAWLAPGRGGLIEGNVVSHLARSLTAARVSRSTSRRRIVSRLSCTCLPRARASDTFTRPFWK